MKTKTIMVISALLVVTGVFYVSSRSVLNDLRAPVTIRFESPQAKVPDDLLLILAGEFKGLWADYMLLEVGSFAGSGAKASQNDYQNLYHTLKQSLILDPYFQQTYLIAQGILPWKFNMVRESMQLLDIARLHRFWDWRPAYYMGFDYYFFLNDYAEASKLFLEAAKVEGAPVLLAVLGGRFAVRGERTEAAIFVLKQMLEDQSLKGNDRLELEDRLTALEGVWLLERAVERYRQQTDTYPPDLEALISHGIIRSIPRNPYVDHYYYDPQTGRVAFDSTK